MVTKSFVAARLRSKSFAVTTTVSFDEVPEAIERLERGDVVGRLVISYE